jgi:hypothetical protein
MKKNDNNIIKCPDSIFKQFEEGCGNIVTPDKNGRIFLFEALGEAGNFTGLKSLDIGKLSDKIFSDWDLFRYWCDDIKIDILWQLIDEESFYDISEKYTPMEYFESKTIAEEKVIKIASKYDPEAINQEILSVEIESKDGKKLSIIFYDADTWALGHEANVLVVKSLDDLLPEDGFYPIEY